MSHLKSTTKSPTSGDDYTNARDCPECDGAGEVEVEYHSRMSFTQPYGDIYTAIEECETCGGSGYLIDED